MANRTLIRQFEASDIDAQLDLLFHTGTDLENWLPEDSQTFDANKIVTGTVVDIRGEDVIVDIGYKSEGVIKVEEWREDGADKATPPGIGEKVEVLLETVEDDEGTISLSYRKAKRQKEWEAILEKHKEGDVVKGKVLKKIKGGLLVNIGVNVFLPASQVDIRRPQQHRRSTSARTIECTILKIDEVRRNIVISRRKLIEDRRKVQREEAALRDCRKSQIRKGVVKNIADFGAFVDLGGIDGLLHITDMGWHRVTNPHDVVKIDQELEVYILGHRPREAEDRPLAQAQDAEPVAEHRGQVPGQQPALGRSRQHHAVRGVREARSRASKASCTSPRCRGRSGSTTRTKSSASATRSRCRCSTSTTTRRKSRSA